MKHIQDVWFGTAAGLALDPDKAYGLQCVDVVDHYAETIFGIRWQDCVGGVNGAKDLPYTVPAEYWTWYANDPENPGQLPAKGDVLVWGGSASNAYGHTAVAETVQADGAWVIQQNSNGLANQAAHRAFMRWYQDGTGMLTGWLRPNPGRVLGTGSEIKLLTVTAESVKVRTSPEVRPDNLAPEYPHGIAQGAQLAVIGYVQGQDPYPNDGVQDDAWVVTKSGYYAWANAVGNDLTGLPKL